MEAVVHLVHLRCKYFTLPYGDQALFLRREVFRCLGGFPAVPLLEDYDLVRIGIACHMSPSTLMKMSGAEHLPEATKATHKWNADEKGLYAVQRRGVCILHASVKTSARRWRHNGVVLNTIINQVHPYKHVDN